MRRFYKILALSFLFSLFFTWSTTDDAFNIGHIDNLKNMFHEEDQYIPELWAYSDVASSPHFSAETRSDFCEFVIDEMAFLNVDPIETINEANLYINSDSFFQFEEDKPGLEPGAVAILGIGILGLLAIIRRRVGEPGYGSQDIQKFGDLSNTKSCGCLSKDSMPMNKTLKTQCSNCSNH